MYRSEGTPALCTGEGKPLADELGGERAVLLIPADVFESGGSYEKLRACADAICRSTLHEELPPEWQELHHSDLLNADDKPMQIIPKTLKENKNFTKASWQDPHILLKLFTRQYPYGTGGFQSALKRFKASCHRPRNPQLRVCFLS